MATSVSQLISYYVEAGNGLNITLEERKLYLNFSILNLTHNTVNITAFYPYNLYYSMLDILLFI